MAEAEPLASDGEFFAAATVGSKTKIAIVTKYFAAWAQVIIPTAKRHSKRIAYIDLFSGPGFYRDGTKSTPLVILEQAVAHPDMSQMLVSVFSDKEKATTDKLQEAIKQLPNIGRLKYAPEVRTMEVGAEVVKTFQSMKLVPTLLFLDPWGYKGLSLELINSVVKDWACECVFFFNYNRINMGISNPSLKTRMDEVLGAETAETLRQTVRMIESAERERAILKHLAEALTKTYGRFVLPFRFYSEDKRRVSHFLIFVTKHFLGYDIMKTVMANASSSFDQGVPSFEYNPHASETEVLPGAGPLDNLEDVLSRDLAGQTLSMKSIYEAHSVGRPYVSKNYKDVLKKLEAAGKIRATPPASERKPNSFADGVKVEFPAI
jgi:three-Cys-motif partner protein